MTEAKKKAVTTAKKKSETVEAKAKASKLSAKNPAVKAKETTKESKEVVEAVETKAEPEVAKAGKRSSKALHEAEEKQAKEERKALAGEAAPKEKPKKIHKPARSKLERRGKKFREVAKLIDSSKEYGLKDALALVIKTSPTKFDATVELHINLGVDPKQADQNIRGTVALPAGTGKALRVAVMADADDVAAAKKAGADIAGIEEVIALLDKETLNFDVLVSTPQQMAKLGKYAKLLGPRGLMPNPKSGTVTVDVAKAVTEAKAGKVEYRVDSTGIVHLGVGKVSFGETKLEQNVEAVMTGIRSAKPASLKGVFLKSAYITTTMGPSIRLTIN